MPRHHVLKRRNPPPQSRRKESSPQSPQCSKKEAPQAEELNSLGRSATRWPRHVRRVPHSSWVPHPSRAFCGKGGLPLQFDPPPANTANTREAWLTCREGLTPLSPSHQPQRIHIRSEEHTSELQPLTH